MDDTDVFVGLSKEEATTVCHIGEGAKCCAFLAVGSKGLECLKMTSVRPAIAARLKAGTMAARGTGGGVGCKHEDKSDA